MSVHEIYFKSGDTKIYLENEIDLGKDVKLYYNPEDTGVTFKCLTEINEISGNHYPLEFVYDLGGATGTVKTQYGTLGGIPIRIIGRYNSSVVIDTNYFGNEYWNYGGGVRNTFNSYLTGKVDPITSATYPTTPGGNIAPDGYPYVNFPLVDVVTFNKSTSSPDLVDMEVYVPMTTSSWFIKMECAGGSPSFYELQLTNKTETNISPCPLTEHYFTFTYTGNLSVGTFLSGYTIVNEFNSENFKILNSNEPSFPYGGGNYYIKVNKYDAKVISIISCVGTTTTTTTNPLITTTTTTQIPTSCGQELNINEVGSSYPYNVSFDLGTSTGIVYIFFNPYAYPDRLIINTGIDIIDTGYFGSSQFNYGGSNREWFNSFLRDEIDPITLQSYPFVDSSHAPDGYPIIFQTGISGYLTISINKTSPTPNVWNFSIYAPMANTAWTLVVSCPE